MSSTVGDSAPVTGTGDRLGLKPGMVVQELGWDNDTDDELRVAVEDCIDADMVDGDYGNVVDAVLLWWRDEDGDLVDGLVDALTDLHRALEGLTLDQRAVVALHYLADLTVPEVAAILGIPAGTAKSRLNAALVVLRRRLGEVR